MINTINHIGVGSVNAQETLNFFKNNLDFKMKMNDFKAKKIEELEPLLKEVPKMRVINCGCLYGGGFLEIFQYLDRTPRRKVDEYHWSNTGFLEAGIQVIGLKELYDGLRKKTQLLTGLEQFSLGNGTVWDSVYLKSPEGFIIHLLDKHSGETAKKPAFAGIHHVTIGVHDLEKTASFYQELMGFDRMVFRGKIGKEQLNQVMPGNYDAEMVILERSKGSTSKMSSYTGGMIFLVQTQAPEKKNIYHNRVFGDPGISELGFDVTDIQATYDELVQKGAKPLVKPLDFNWFPGPQGSLAYLADCEGNILELIETKKVFGMDVLLIDKMFLQPMKRLNQ